MRILVFTTAYDPLIGGAELALKEVIEKLPEHNFDILTAKHRSNLSKFENRGHIKIYRLGLGISLDRYLFTILAPLAVWNLRRHYNYDLAWAMMANQAGFAALLCHYLMKLPYLLSLQEGDSESWIKRREIMSLGTYRLIYRRAKAIQAISNYLAQRARNYSFTGEIYVVPNGLNSDQFKKVSPEDKIELRKKLDLPIDAKILVTSSRLVHKNAIDDLIKAAAEIPNIFLLIVGDGPLRGYLKALSNNLKISQRVKFIGEVPYADLPPYLQASDVFARPSLSEGLGTAFLEALACGLPIVGTSVGGIPDFLKDKETGLISKINDPKDLAEKIQVLMQDQDLRNLIVFNGQEIIRERHQWSVIASKMNEIFEQAILLRSISS